MYVWAYAPGTDLDGLGGDLLPFLANLKPRWYFTRKWSPVSYTVARNNISSGVVVYASGCPPIGHCVRGLGLCADLVRTPSDGGSPPTCIYIYIYIHIYLLEITWPWTWLHDRIVESYCVRENIARRRPFRWNPHNVILRSGLILRFVNLCRSIHWTGYLEAKRKGGSCRIALKHHQIPDTIENLRRVNTGVPNNGQPWRYQDLDGVPIPTLECLMTATRCMYSHNTENKLFWITCSYSIDSMDCEVITLACPIIPDARTAED